MSSNNDLINKKSVALLSRLKSNKSKKLIKDALEFSVKMHHGQERKSGLPYVSHCIDVANILLDWNMDATTIASALLHDVVEDTDVTLEDIKLLFGNDVAFLVDGVTKIDNIVFKSEKHKQAENFTKLFLSLAKDLRVIIIKFADRLNNMETIEYLSPKKRKEVATETREIFVPLAHRLGMAKLKWDLEDLSLKCLDIKGYNKVDKKILESSKVSESIINNAIKPIKRELKQYKINLRQVQKERNSFLRLIREFNESPIGKYKDGRLLIDVLDDEKICEELEYEHWTYRMAKQTALDWIAYGRPGIGNMDAVFQLEGEQQEQVLKLALELFARNEMRIKRLTDEVNERIQKGLPPSSGAQLLEITEKDNVRNIQGRNTPRITEHDPTDW